MHRSLIIIGLVTLLACCLVVEAHNGPHGIKHKPTKIYRGLGTSSPRLNTIRAVSCQKDACAGPVVLTFATQGCQGDATYTQVMDNESDYDQCLNKKKTTAFDDRVEVVTYADDGCTALSGTATRINYFGVCRSDIDAGTSLIYLKSSSDAFQPSNGPFDPDTSVPWRQSWLNVRDCEDADCKTGDGESPDEIVTHYSTAGCDAGTETGSLGFYPRYSNFSLGDCAYEVPSKTNILSTCADGLFREYHFQSGCTGEPTYSIAITTSCVQTGPAEWTTRRCLRDVPEYVPSPTSSGGGNNTDPAEPNAPDSSAPTMALAPIVYLALAAALVGLLI